MTGLPKLLPPNPNAFQDVRYQSAGADKHELPVPLREIKRPFECPPELLPYLAFERSVDIWDTDWPDEVKRFVIDESIRLHLLKGTLAGMRAYLRIAGAELVRAIVPPDKTFLMSSMTAEERQTWLSRFPQIRIYPFVTRSQQQYKTFCRHFLGQGHPYDSQTFTRYGRRAKLYEPRDGTETDLTLRSLKITVREGEATDFEQIVLPAKRSHGLFLGARPVEKMFLWPSDYVAERVVSIARKRAYSYRVGQVQYNTVAPSWTPVDVRPEGIARKGTATYGQMFPGATNGKSFLPPSTAWQRIYERIFLHDPSRMPDARPRTTHLGHTRLGMPAYHAELTVAVRGKRSVYAAGKFVSGFLVKSSTEPLDSALHAIRMSKAARDKILVNTKTTRTLRVGDPYKVGTVKVGGLVPNF